LCSREIHAKIRIASQRNQERIMNAYGAYSIVAGVSGLASLALGFGVVKTLNQITNEGMWAIAAMTFAPALLGIGVSLFICLSHRAEPRERRYPPVEPFDSGAFTPTDR
jgi:hypothetical protein